MIRHLVFASALMVGTLAVASFASDWAFKQSYYSHDQANGQRVTQYSPGQTAYANIESNYQQSAYRHQRIRLGGPGGSADNIHIVETWGEGENIRPYGEWERPYRAGATPYGPWGNPQGPWTLPFESWVNPYGLGQLPNPPYPYDGYAEPYQQPQGQPYQQPMGGQGQMGPGASRHGRSGRGGGADADSEP